MGGIYENEEFYRHADEKHLGVADFILDVPTRPTTLSANVAEEVAYNIKRLRNHASLAFWCGNNEVEEGLRYWGWQREYPEEVMNAWFGGYDKHSVNSFQPWWKNMMEPSYIHGSPYDSNWEDPKSLPRAMCMIGAMVWALTF